MADMHLIYGREYSNTREARRLCQQSFPNGIFHRGKHLSTLIVAYERQEHFSLLLQTRGDHYPSKHLTEHIEQDPAFSTMKIAAVENVSHMTVWRVLHRQLLYPYHLQRVQGLGPADFPAIEDFCQWLVHQCALNPFFVSSVLFTDEAAFIRNGIINFHSNHLWAEKNPHAVV
jgi:hypothetical protein